MSFDLDDKPRVWIPIYWPGLAPGDEPDDVAKVVEHRVDLLVEIIDRDEGIALFDSGEVDNLTAFKRVVTDWRKVVSKGHPIPFEDANINRLIGLPSFVSAFQLAYIEAMMGRVAIREKNSESSLKGGPVRRRARKA